jgi:hypothetical protein
VDSSQVSEGLTSGDWLGIIGVMATLAGVLGMVIFNMVMKRLDEIGGKQDRQGRNITRICTHLGIEEDT